MDSFTGKTVVLLGGICDLGICAAKQFAAQGANVLLTGLPENFDKVPFRKDRAQISTVSCDIRNPKEIDSLFNYAAEIYGHVDIVICMEDQKCSTPFTKVSPNELWRLYEVNCRGTQLACLRSAAEMQKSGRGGRIICVTDADIEDGNLTYTASKSYLASFIQYLNAEFGKDGVGCNCVAIHHMDSEKYLKSITEVFLFLAAETSCNIMGQEIPITAFKVNGGMQ